MEIVSFESALVGRAAALLVATLSSLAETDPILGELFAHERRAHAMLADAAVDGSGVAAVVGDALLGYMLAPPPAGDGARSVRIRLHEHAAQESDRRDTYRRMYEVLACGRLLETKLSRHEIDVPVADQVGVQTWFELGFGVDQIKGVRTLDSVGGDPMPIEIRRACSDDLDALVALASELIAFHLQAPIFGPLGPLEPGAVRRMVEADLASQGAGAAVLVALDQGRVVGLMTVHRDGALPTVATIGTAIVNAAARSHGVGTYMLGRVIEWARGEDFRGCAAQWTSANTVSDAFWRRHGFRPWRYRLARELTTR